MCLVCPGIVPFQLPHSFDHIASGHGDERERVEGNHLEIGPVTDENENFGMCDRLEPTSTYYTDWACGVSNGSRVVLPRNARWAAPQIDNQRSRRRRALGE